MSILIKGIDMPKECEGIELVFIPKDGDIIYNPHESMSIGAEQIVEIPTPHGRLIDEKQLKEALTNPITDETSSITWGDIDNAPTILEAEE